MSSSSGKIIDRIKKLKGFKTDAKLSEYWNIAPTTVTSWRKRNSIPFERIMAFCNDEVISLDYIFTGEGEMTLKWEKDAGTTESPADIFKNKESVTEDEPDNALKTKLIRTQAELIDQMKLNGQLQNRLIEMEEKARLSEELAARIREEDPEALRSELLKKRVGRHRKTGT